MKIRQVLGPAAAIAALLACALPAAAQTLYKLIDKDGKVTYSEKPPKDFAGKVVPIEIDPNRNTATLPKPLKSEDTPPNKAKPRPARTEGQKGVDSEDLVREAKEKLESARKALQDAVDNPGPEDIARVGTVKGGARPVYSEAYARRLNDLEAKVKLAEKELERAEENR